MSKEKAWRWIDEHQDELVETSDKIWGYAELGLCEEKSSKLLAEKLRQYGFRVRHGVAGMPTAIAAEWGKGKPVIANASLNNKSIDVPSVFLDVIAVDRKNMRDTVIRDGFHQQNDIYGEASAQ